MTFLSDYDFSLRTFKNIIFPKNLIETVKRTNAIMIVGNSQFGNIVKKSFKIDSVLSNKPFSCNTAWQRCRVLQWVIYPLLEFNLDYLPYVASL